MENYTDPEELAFDGNGGEAYCPAPEAAPHPDHDPHLRHARRTPRGGPAEPASRRKTERRDICDETKHRYQGRRTDVETPRVLCRRARRPQRESAVRIPCLCRRNSYLRHHPREGGIHPHSRRVRAYRDKVQKRKDVHPRRSGTATAVPRKRSSKDDKRDGRNNSLPREQPSVKAFPTGDSDFLL